MADKKGKSKSSSSKSKIEDKIAKQKKGKSTKTMADISDAEQVEKSTNHDNDVNLDSRNSNPNNNMDEAGQKEKAEVKTSSKLAQQIGFLLFFLLFIAGGTWSYFSSIAGAVIAPGQIVVLGEPKTIQHLDGGIVAEIFVANGDRVAAGDQLIRLDDTLIKANINIYENRLRESLAQQARLRAERDEADNIIWDNDLLSLLEIGDKREVNQGQQKLFEARRTTRLGQIAQLNEKIRQFDSQAVGIAALKDSRKRQQGFLEQELDSIRQLKRKKLVANSQLMALERQREEIIGQLAEQDAELARIKNAVSEAKIQILQINREFVQSVLTELRKVEQQVNDMTQQLVVTREQLKRIDIKAPVAGVIHELGIFTIGGVISPGGPVMQIIPQDQGFEVEANIEPQFVDELYPGQEAKMVFSAFNQRTTPELNGNVKTISPNVVINEQTGMSFYKIRLVIPSTELTRLKSQKLVAGMPVESFIKTRDRSPLDYLLKPLTDQFRRALKEE